MSDQPRTPYLGRYILIVLATIVAVAVLRNLLALVLNVQLSAGGLALLPPLVAAMLVGQRWGRERGTVPTNSEAWRWAVVAGIAFLALQLLLTPLFLIATQLPIEGGLIGVLALALAFFTAVAIFVHRFFLVMGARGAIKAK